MKIQVNVVYNGVTKTLTANPHEAVQALLQQAIQAFATHQLVFYREDGTEVVLTESVEAAGIKQGTTLLLRPHVVRGGGV